MSRPDAPVGVIGLGIMGGAIAANLVRRGFSVVGCDVDRERMRALEAQGLELVSNPAAAVARADVLITSLPSAGALIDVIEGPDGVASAAAEGCTVVECSTLDIPTKERCREALAAAGGELLDCPLSGTGAQAVTGDLVVFASGAPTAYERVVPVFEGFARAWFHLGPFGHGSRTKFVANLLVAIHNVAAAEAIVLARKAGLDAARTLEVLTAGAGTSRVLELRGPMMVERDYAQATMKMEVWRKDMAVIGAFAEALGSATPLFSRCAALYERALDDGHGAEDTAAVCSVLERMAGLDRAR